MEMTENYRFVSIVMFHGFVFRLCQGIMHGSVCSSSAGVGPGKSKCPLVWWLERAVEEHDTTPLVLFAIVSAWQGS